MNTAPGDTTRKGVLVVIMKGVPLARDLSAVEQRAADERHVGYLPHPPNAPLSDRIVEISSEDEEESEARSDRMDLETLDMVPSLSPPSSGNSGDVVILDEAGSYAGLLRIDHGRMQLEKPPVMRLNQTQIQLLGSMNSHTPAASQPQLERGRSWQRDTESTQLAPVTAVPLMYTSSKTQPPTIARPISYPVFFGSSSDDESDEDEEEDFMRNSAADDVRMDFEEATGDGAGEADERIRSQIRGGRGGWGGRVSRGGGGRGVRMRGPTLSHRLRNRPSAPAIPYGPVGGGRGVVPARPYYHHRHSHSSPGYYFPRRPFVLPWRPYWLTATMLSFWYPYGVNNYYYLDTNHFGEIDLPLLPPIPLVGNPSEPDFERKINKKLRSLRSKYAYLLEKGYDIVPYFPNESFEGARFVWVLRHS